jgi:hypothetical protein
VIVLLDYGADPANADHRGITPLMLASTKEYMEAVKRLLWALGGQGLDAQTERGATAFWGACNAGDVDIARLLLLEGADHTIGDHDGVTARMQAESKGHEECVALIQVRTTWVAVSETTRLYGLHINAFGLMLMRYIPMPSATISGGRASWSVRTWRTRPGVDSRCPPRGKPPEPQCPLT